MRLKIRNIKNSNGAEIVVEGETGLGVISGFWKSKHTPVVGEDYDVELTLPDPQDLQILSNPNDRQPGVVAGSSDRYRFRGECEVVYDDGVICVRYASNWIDMVGAENFACNVGDWVEFSIPLDQIEIYPIDG